jgi:chemotaxis protein histidine kinase CheA
MFRALNSHKFLQGDIANFIYSCKTENNLDLNFIRTQTKSFKEIATYSDDDESNQFEDKEPSSCLEKLSQSIEEQNQPFEETIQLKEKERQKQDKKTIEKANKEEETKKSLIKHKEVELIDIMDDETIEKKKQKFEPRKTRKRTRKEYETIKQPKEKEKTKELTQFQTSNKKEKEKKKDLTINQTKKRIRKNKHKASESEKDEHEQITLDGYLNRRKKDEEEKIPNTYKKQKRPGQNSKKMKIFKTIIAQIVASKSTTTYSNYREIRDNFTTNIDKLANQRGIKAKLNTIVDVFLYLKVIELYEHDMSNIFSRKEAIALYDGNSEMLRKPIKELIMQYNKMMKR